MHLKTEVFLPAFMASTLNINGNKAAGKPDIVGLTATVSSEVRVVTILGYGPSRSLQTSMLSILGLPLLEKDKTMTITIMNAGGYDRDFLDNGTCAYGCTDVVVQMTGSAGGGEVCARDYHQLGGEAD